MNKGFYALFFLFFLLSSCSKKQGEQQSSTPKRGEVLQVEYATGFAIQHQGEKYQLTLRKPFQDREDSLVFYFNAESLEESSRDIISKPEKVVVLSSTHSAFFAALDKIDLIKAISTSDYFYNARILDRVSQGIIKEVGIGANINVEELIVLDPDLLLISGGSSQDYSEYAVLQQAGITIIPLAEWQEQHPLGRSEWIKVIGLLTGSYEKADSIFQSVKANYQSLNTLEFDEEPKTIINSPYKDNWWLPGGKSYVSELLDDAGAYYPWREDENTGGLQADFEMVFHKAQDASYWINPGSYHSLQELLNQDSRYSEFKAFQLGNVFNNNLRARQSGGNDYYETGTVRPDIILSDLISIFHPEKLPDHTPFFYQQLK